MVLEEPPMSALDLGMALDARGIAVRTGHHCCQPLMDRMKISATTRASLAMYNTRAEIDALADALNEIVARSAARQRSSGGNRSASGGGAREGSADADAAVVSQRPAEIHDDATGTTPAGIATPAADAHDTVAYPAPSADSPQSAADELAENFEFLDERDARNEYILEMSARLPHTFDLLKKITSRVPGCMSEVYIVGRPDPGDSQRLQFIADANAEIVRGLIAILERLYSGQRGMDILNFDIEAFFRRIGLDQFITTQRRNGLAGMVSRIRALASQLTQPASAKK
jgi:cysteine desulfurase/selenocysteine lyase